MSRNYAMTAAKREQAGKGAARSLRREGKIPAVIYGDKKEPVSITLESNPVNVEYKKGHMFTSLCDMDVAGQKHLVLARDVQLHPVTDVVEHIDFLRVTPKTKIAVYVPVHIIGQEASPAMKAKGVLNITRHEVEMVCNATDIPDFVEVDISKKKLGDAVKASDAIMPAGAKFVIDNRDFTIAVIGAPKVADDDDDAAVEGAEGEAAEGEAAEGAEGDAAEGDKE